MRRMLLSFALAVLCAAPVSAQILNGDFTTSLASWTTSSTGPTVSHHPSNGNPGGAAYIFYNWGGGGASLEQAFTCGSSHGTSSCAVTLDYQYYVLGGAAVQVIIEIDNTVAYSATHAAENPVWQTIPLAVPCGNHVLRLSANTITLGSFGSWSVFVDNVAAECTDVVGEETQAWGVIKGLYR